MTLDIAIYKRDQLIERRQLTHGELIIGRGNKSDIALKGLRVSKRHAVVRYVSGECTIEDLSSMSGTYVNDERIVDYGPLSALDDIKIAYYRIDIKVERVVANHSEMNPQSIDDKKETQSTCDPTDSIDSQESELMTEQQDLAVFNHWREQIHQMVIEEMDLRRKNLNDMTESEMRSETETLVTELIQKVSSELDQVPGLDLARLTQAVIDDSIGLGPLEELLTDHTISEIIVNSPSEIFVEKNGRIVKSDFVFGNDEAVRSVIDRIITPLGRRIDESSPMVDARLKDGSRVNAIIPPLALKGPCITIRKFSKKRLEIEDLIGFGSMNDEMAAFFRLIVEQKKNIIVAGGTGTGKTSLLNVLSNLIPDSERIITVEDAAELRLNQPDLVSLESKPPNLEGKGAITIRDLVKNSLRMRPDRIVVGECRGGETLDMLQAMNTGHDGSLTTIHANSARDCISRLEVMVLMAGMELPLLAIREQIASAVSMFIQLTRFPCGSRKITAVTEVSGVESGTIQLEEIFRFRKQGVTLDGKTKGVYEATGFVPSFVDDLESIGEYVDRTIFKQRQESV